MDSSPGAAAPWNHWWNVGSTTPRKNCKTSGASHFTYSTAPSSHSATPMSASAAPSPRQAPPKTITLEQVWNVLFTSCTAGGPDFGEGSNSRSPPTPATSIPIPKLSSSGRKSKQSSRADENQSNSPPPALKPRPTRKASLPVDPSLLYQELLKSDQMAAQSAVQHLRQQFQSMPMEPIPMSTVKVPSPSRNKQTNDAEAPSPIRRLFPASSPPRPQAVTPTREPEASSIVEDLADEDSEDNESDGVSVLTQHTLEELARWMPEHLERVASEQTHDPKGPRHPENWTMVPYHSPLPLSSTRSPDRSFGTGSSSGTTSFEGWKRREQDYYWKKYAAADENNSQLSPNRFGTKSERLMRAHQITARSRQQKQQNRQPQHHEPQMAEI